MYKNIRKQLTDYICIDIHAKLIRVDISNYIIPISAKFSDRVFDRNYYPVYASVKDNIKSEIQQYD
jgi:hypothetical protein